MYRTLNTQFTSPFQQAEANHKDLVIAALKKQLYQLKDLQTDFLRLNQEITHLQSKYSLLLDQKERNQKQHRLKMQINKKTILEMKVDLDNLKSQIHKTSVQIDETLRQNTTLKRMCDNRGTEINSLISVNRQLQKENESKIEENQNLNFKIKQLKEQKKKIQSQCQKLSNLLDSNIALLKQTEKQARNLEISNTKLDNTLMEAEKDNQKLLQQLKTRQINCAKSQNNLNQLTQKTQDLINKSKHLESERNKLENQYDTVTVTLQSQINKNKELASKLKILDNTIRVTQKQLDQSMLKKENLRRQHLDLVSDNRGLNSQIDKCLLSILELEKLNTDLQREVENYIESDEHARNLLNRKDVMRSLLDQVNSKLGKTSEQISHLR